MIFISLLPVFVLLIYIYKCDYKPEPLKMILRGLFYGVCSVSLVLVLMQFLDCIGLRNLFNEDAPTFASKVLEAFVRAAIPEELSKLLMLHLLLRKNKYFDEHIDGIVYATCVGLGFAGYENIFYVYGNENWIMVGLLRAISAVPCHFMTAVAMGYYYSLYRFDVDGKKMQWMRKMILIPILFHGIYDAILMSVSTVGAVFSSILFIGFIFWMNSMRKFSKEKIAELKGKDIQYRKNEDYLS